MTTDNEKISSLYKQGNDQVPPAHLDNTILNAAHEAVSGKEKSRTAAGRSAKAKSPFSGGWPATAAIAAVLIITLILVPVINREVPPERSRFADKSPALLPEQDSITRMNVYQDDLEIEPEVKKRLKAEMPAMQLNRRSPQKLPDSLGSSLLKAGKTEHAKQIISEEPVSTMDAPIQSTLPKGPVVPAAAAIKSKAAEEYVQKLDAEKEQRTSSGLMAYEEFPDVLTAKEWLKKIQLLIDQGELDVAKKEIDEFKKHYPDEEVGPLILNQLEKQ